MQSRTFSEYTDLKLQPPAADWGGLLEEWIPEFDRLQEVRRSARQRLVRNAEEFLLRLRTLADDADLPELHNPLLTGDPADLPIVMTGHQPVVFHSGLTFKYETTQKFASGRQAIGVAVLIDTDQGDAGQFCFPASAAGAAAAGAATGNFAELSGNDGHPVTDGDGTAVALPRVELQIESLAVSMGLYGHSRLKPAAKLEQFGAQLSERLKQFGQVPAGDRVRVAMSQYAQLAATRATTAEANSILRRQHGIGDRLLELPLSAISAFPESLLLTADILKQSRRFAAAYNSALDVFRDEHGIRNTANPFPNLKITGDTCELPFWVISHNRRTRHVLEVQSEGNVTRLLANNRVVDTFAGSITPEALEPMLLQNICIVPRGALITAFLRLLFSDLFVHGTGGARYDRFTDEFIRSWWNVEPSAFTVASASRYLFPQAQAELRRLETIQSELRDLQYNPQRHFESGVFSEDLQTRLQHLTASKLELVRQMKQIHAGGESGREIGRRIQQVSDQIRDAVSAEFDPQVSRLTAVTPEQRDAINCRTYPWFMFC